VSSSDAAEDASNAQVDAANNANAMQIAAMDRQLAFQKEQYQKALELQAPFRETGLAANTRLADLLGLSSNTTAPGFGSMQKEFDMNTTQQDPGYNFRLTEGLKALDRTAAARGGLLSGATLRGAQRYGQDLASQEYQNAFNRYQVNRANTLQPLQSLLGVAQTSTNALSQAGSDYANNSSNINANYANNYSNNTIGAGNSRASMYVGQANAYNNGIQGGLNGFLGYLNSRNSGNGYPNNSSNPYADSGTQAPVTDYSTIYNG
jgi:hypothetical protein